MLEDQDQCIPPPPPWPPQFPSFYSGFLTPREVNLLAIILRDNSDLMLWLALLWYLQMCRGLLLLELSQKKQAQARSGDWTKYVFWRQFLDEVCSLNICSFLPSLISLPIHSFKFIEYKLCSRHCSGMPQIKDNYDKVPAFKKLTILWCSSQSCWDSASYKD